MDYRGEWVRRSGILKMNSLPWSYIVGAEGLSGDQVNAVMPLNDGVSCHSRA